MPRPNASHDVHVIIVVLVLGTTLIYRHSTRQQGEEAVVEYTRTAIVILDVVHSQEHAMNQFDGDYGKWEVL